MLQPAPPMRRGTTTDELAVVTRHDVRAVLEQAVADVPELLLRTQVICDAQATGIEVRRCTSWCAPCSTCRLGLPATADVWVSATPVDGALLLTVEDDGTASGATPARADHVSETLLLARAIGIARRLGGALWVEEGHDGGLVFVAELPDPAATGR